MSYGIRYDLLSEDRIKSVLKSRFIPQKVYAFWSIGTTNDFAYRMAQQGDGDGTLVIAEKQERGRGRKSRTWDSPFLRGLWFSLILRPDLPSAKAGLIPYLAGVSVSEAVESMLNIQPDMKWPNDLLINNKKFCGILSEVDFNNGKVNFIVLGIGINVNQLASEWPKDIVKTATSLRLATEKIIDRAELLAEILLKLEENYEHAKIDGFEGILRKWKKRCSKVRKEIVIQQENQRFQGKFVNIDEDGCLLLKYENGEIKKIFAGDILY